MTTDIVHPSASAPPPSLAPAPPPILSLEGLCSRDSAGVGGAARGSIADLWLRLGVGAHGVLGAPEDGTIALVEAISGATKATRGRVLVGSLDPRKHAAARRRIASTSHAPALPIAKTTVASVGCAIAERALHSQVNDPGGALGILRKFGLAFLADRPLRGLSWEERRGVELAIALSVRADLHVLFEPFARTGAVDEAAVVLQIESLARAACVIVVTSSPGDLRRLTKSALVLHRGGLVRAEGGTLDGLAALSRTDLFVAVADKARALVGALGEDERVVSVSLELANDGEGGFLRLGGRDPVALGAALARATRQIGPRVLSVNELQPTLAEVRQQTEWLQYAAYVAASRAQQAQGQGGAAHHPAPPAALPEAAPVSRELTNADAAPNEGVVAATESPTKETDER